MMVARRLGRFPAFCFLCTFASRLGYRTVSAFSAELSESLHVLVVVCSSLRFLALVTGPDAPPTPPLLPLHGTTASFFRSLGLRPSTPESTVLGGCASATLGEELESEEDEREDR